MHYMLILTLFPSIESSNILIPAMILILIFGFEVNFEFIFDLPF